MLAPAGGSEWCASRDSNPEPAHSERNARFYLRAFARRSGLVRDVRVVDVRLGVYLGLVGPGDCKIPPGAETLLPLVAVPPVPVAVPPVCALFSVSIFVKFSVIDSVALEELSLETKTSSSLIVM